MRPGDEFVIAPRGYHAFRLPRGSQLSIVDLEGKQCCDFVSFVESDPRERFSTHATIMRNRTIYLSTGHVLYSSLHKPLFTIVEDTVGSGGHDLLAGTCSQASNEARFSVQGTPNCTANLTAALAAFDIHGSLLGGAFNIFMQMSVSPSGTLEIREPRSQAGDHIDLCAEVDCIVAISNCPQEWGPTNARQPTPILLRAL